MTSKPSTFAEYVAELDRLIEQPLPSFDPTNPNSAMKFVKASILKNHRLNTAGVLRHLIETAADRPMAPLTTWIDRDGLPRPAILSYDEAMQQAIDWNLTAVELEKTLSAAQDRLTRAEGDVEYGRRYCQQLADALEHEKKANARLLKTIDEVCTSRADWRDLAEKYQEERDDLSRRLSDIVDFVLGGDKPSDEDVEFNPERQETSGFCPEPGQYWHTINKDYDFIYRWNEDASSILIWRPWKGAWEDSSYKSFTNIEKQYGDLEPVENPESNA